MSSRPRSNCTDSSGRIASTWTRGVPGGAARWLRVVTMRKQVGGSVSTNGSTCPCVQASSMTSSVGWSSIRSPTHRPSRRGSAGARSVLPRIRTRPVSSEVTRVSDRSSLSCTHSTPPVNRSSAGRLRHRFCAIHVLPNPPEPHTTSIGATPARGSRTCAATASSTTGRVTYRPQRAGVIAGRLRSDAGLERIAVSESSCCSIFPNLLSTASKRNSVASGSSVPPRRAFPAMPRTTSAARASATRSPSTPVCCQ